MGNNAFMIQTKRVYAPTSKTDGTRVLVERLWPRGISKEKAHLHEWMKEIAPSPELRKWFAHDPQKWDEFQKRYRAELKQQPALVEQLRAYSRRGALILVYAAHDEEHNSAILLKSFLEQE